MSEQVVDLGLPDWKDFGERILRAFYTGALGALGGLGLGSDLGVDETLVVHGWKAILVGGVLSALTAAKAGIAQGRGSNPADGSAR